MYDTRFKGSFKATSIYVYKPRSIRKRTLGSISCNTTTSRSLRPIPLNWVPLEQLQDSDSSLTTIGPHWPSSYPKYLSPDWDKNEQQRVVWNRLQSQHFNLANRLSDTKARYLALHQELNPRTTQAESSHELLYRDIHHDEEGAVPQILPPVDDIPDSPIHYEDDDTPEDLDVPDVPFFLNHPTSCHGRTYSILFFCILYGFIWWSIRVWVLIISYDKMVSHVLPPRA